MKMQIGIGNLENAIGERDGLDQMLEIDRYQKMKNIEEQRLKNLEDNIEDNQHLKKRNQKLKKKRIKIHL